MSSLAIGSQACFITFVGSVAAFDALQRRVPNSLMLTGMLFALIALLLGKQLEGVSWASSLLGLIVGLLAFLPLYLLELMGAGDVKFFSMIGLWLGVYALLPVWLVASIIAGLQAMLWLALSEKNGKSGSVAVLSEALRLKETPYASYLAVGAALMVLCPELLSRFTPG
jgi:prepilin peptidase CpaA